MFLKWAHVLLRNMQINILPENPKHRVKKFAKCIVQMTSIKIVQTSPQESLLAPTKGLDVRCLLGFWWSFLALLIQSNILHRKNCCYRKPLAQRFEDLQEGFIKKFTSKKPFRNLTFQSFDMWHAAISGCFFYFAYKYIT